MNKTGYGSEDEIREIAEAIWNELKFSGSYLFPKAHSTAYSLIANATQYLKIYYPTEFFCSFLEQATDDEYMLIYNVSKKKYKVRYILPNINISKEKFIINNNKIVWSLTSIKGVGIKAAEAIATEQPFSSFEDFFKRVNKRVVNVKVGRLLITSNSFRKFGDRNEIYKQYCELRKEKDAFEEKSKLEWDTEAMKVMPYIKKPITKMFPDQLKSVMDFEKYSSLDEGRRAIIAGFISSIRYISSKRGKMIIMNIVNEGDKYNIVCWNDMYEKLTKDNIILKEEMPIKVSGMKGISHIGETQITLGKERESYIKVLA